MIDLDHGLAAPEPLLERAWQQPVAQLYSRAGLITQRMRAMCGPTSLALALRSAGIAAEPERVLDDTPVATLFGMRMGGMSLDQVAEVLRIKSGYEVQILRNLSLAEFREQLSLVNDPRHRFIANFDRQPLFGWGGGHHSPLGAYLPDAGAVLVVDTNGKVGPWMVSVPRLHHATFKREPWMDKPRGLARLTLGD